MLSNDSTAHIATTRGRTAFRGIIQALLDFQLVSYNEQIFYVKQGSGMGRILSGDVADMTFWHRAERNLVVTDVLKQNGVLFYARYRDDVILASTNEGVDVERNFGINNFVRQWRQAMAPYTVKLEDWSRTELRILDAVVHKGRSFHLTGFLSSRPYLKDEPSRVRLSSDSYHEPSVLKS